MVSVEQIPDFGNGVAFEYHSEEHGGVEGQVAPD